MNNNIPHKLNNKFIQHPDYAINIIEEVACNAFSHYTQELQKNYNVDINFFLNIDIKNEHGEKEKKELKMLVKEIGASFSLLPIILAVHTQKTYKEVFPKSDYPIGFFIDKQNSLFGSLPTIKNTQNFGSLLYMVDFDINELINKKFVQSLYPFLNTDSYLNFNTNQNLHNELVRIITENDFKTVKLDFTDSFKMYEKLFINSINKQELEHQVETLSDRFSLIEPDIMSLVEHIHKITNNNTDPVKIRISDEMELYNFKKPEFPSAVRYKNYIDEKNRKSRATINATNSGAGNINIYGM